VVSALAYFSDSYALVEMLKGNPAYVKFSNESLVTTAANLSEIYYFALRSGSDGSYSSLIKKRCPELLQPELQDWEAAARFRFENRAKKLSYIDCLGYMLAQRHGLDFLTGDEAFKSMPNVTHVK